ncbi:MULTISPECIES: hypothetical protein [unclassified Sporosarcina]|uniref:hypothetical protein n=1 Tax=unclassified Sporosarcina TaxID=2647733 RepID=UPI002041E3EA|nr:MULTISPECIES: hypothetical protein [unclassified Sporosarcina]GKV66539.1 hypothetical protein NCCP2331_26920 [Sporosarcina sp. NCCP-2331]GLB56816.1 hypothetical protein NCCP2378_26030 [Sporosarcina sp. NCCP-2378]
MKYPKNEKGYALIIVLFAIVFITMITAVFMRGALSNAKQEKTVDENNLTVVAAEAGVDYYTFELKKAYNDEDLKQLLIDKVNESIANEESHINAVRINKEIVEYVKDKINEKVEEIRDLQKITTFDLADDYRHELLMPPSISDKKVESGITEIIVKGEVEGINENESIKKEKVKKLTFELKFELPDIEGYLKNLDGNQEGNVGNDNDFDMNHEIPSNICKNIVDIENENCLFPSGKTSSLESVKDKSKVFINEDYNGHKSIEIQESLFYTKGISNGSNFDVQKSQFHIVGNLNKYGGMKIQESNAYIGGEFSESGSVDFQKSNIIIGKTFNFRGSSGNQIQESIMKVGADFRAPNKITIQKTDLTVDGMMEFRSGSKFEESRLSVGKQLDAPSKLEAQKTEVRIGDFLQLNSGGDFQESNFHIGSYLNSPQTLNLQKTKMYVGGYLQINTESKFEESAINIENYFKSPNKIIIQKSAVTTKNTNIDKLNLQETVYCSEDFKARELSMEKSKIFYINSSSHEGNGEDIFKLTKAQYEDTCNLDKQIDEPKPPKLPGGGQPSEIPELPDENIFSGHIPKLEKVEY